MHLGTEARLPILNSSKKNWTDLLDLGYFSYTMIVSHAQQGFM